MKNLLSAKKNFTLDSYQFRISRTDFVNSKCDAFFKWFTTDEQICLLGEAIARNLLGKEELYGQDIRIDLELEYAEYSLFVIFTKKADTFFDIKITNFIKTLKAIESNIPKIKLKDYAYSYKLIPRGSSHFHCVANLEDFKYKIYFSSYLIFKKEHFFKKYNFQRLANDVLKYLIERRLTENLPIDGTPLHVKVKPNIQNETINHMLHVTCSLWHNEKEEGTIKNFFIVDSIRYLSFSDIRKNVFSLDEVFELKTLVPVEKKAKPLGLKIIKKGNSK